MSKSWFAGGSALTILLAAFLLFQVQPIISKMILPWFGGSPAVWTTCMLFFQTGLLVGYAYADGLVRLASVRRQAVIHIILLAAAVAILPITPGDAWKPVDGAQPTLRILLLLGACTGLPFAVLAATSPLVQSWFARACPQRSPYRLYALSNIGSLAALLTYPFLVEPAFNVPTQGRLWSWLYVLFAALCAGLAVSLWRMKDERQSDAATAESALAPRWTHVLAWLLLPAYASMMLLAITNHLCQYVAVVPFLWIVPLSLYLLSFIICFDRAVWYRRPLFSGLAVLSILAVSYLMLHKFLDRLLGDMNFEFEVRTIAEDVIVQAVLYLTVLFAVCMVSHGEVVRIKPPTRWLTTFYLTIAAGGALGGFTVAVVCPSIFSSYVELNIGLVIGFCVAAVVFWRHGRQHWWTRPTPATNTDEKLPASRKSRRRRGATSRTMPDRGELGRGSRLTVTAAGLFFAIMFVTVVWGQLCDFDPEPGLVKQRNFYGVLSVRVRYPNDPEQAGLAMYNGYILHGYQFLEPAKRQQPTTYYLPHSGVGLALTHLRKGTDFRVGVVGLGVGTLATYGKPGDAFRFYEVNPLVIDAAQSHFSFLRESAAEVAVVPGDARLSLEREPAQNLDVLVLDAFSGDAIPSHLLTVEAFEVYLRHLKPGGVIAVHVSNRYLNLVPVVVELARHLGLEEVLISTVDTGGQSVAPADWLLVTRESSVLQTGPIRDAAKIPARFDNAPLWTDKFNSLFEILR